MQTTVLVPRDEPGLTLVVNWPHHAPVLTLTAQLAQRGPVQVIVGGNRFDAQQLARVVRAQTVAVDETLARIQLARPFTCYQLTALLADLTPHAPLLLLDALTTFYDENVSDAESARLLQTAVAHLRRLRREAPVLVTLRPCPMPSRRKLATLLRAIADRVYVYKPPPQEFVQRSLF